MKNYENNLYYDDAELSNKINEYNQLYNNNDHFRDFINNNININNNNYNKDQKTKYIKEKKNNNIVNKNKNINNFIFYDSPSSDFINLSEIENEYDTYISNLKVQLSKERDERKKKEKEAMTIHHRLTLLKNQEQKKLLEVKKVKQHIDRIINNRKKSQEKFNEKLIEKKNLKNINNTSWIGVASSDSQIKKNISCSNFSRKSNKFNLMCNSQSNFHNSKYKKYDFDKNNETPRKNMKEKKYVKNTIDNSDLKKRINNVDLKLNSNNNKKLFKQQLIEKLKQDEEEKRMLKEEIAKIEEEEKMLLIKLGQRRTYNDNNKTRYNNEEYDYGYGYNEV